MNIGGWFAASGAPKNYALIVPPSSGNVGVGTTNPRFKLEVNSSDEGQAVFFRTDAITGTNYGIDAEAAGSGATTNIGGWFAASGASHNYAIVVPPGAGNVGIGTTTPGQQLEVVGTTKTQILEITGGSDLAEPFEMGDNADIQSGAVVVIDPDHPGQLKLSDRAYDRRVAGIVSGAGGIKPGMTMHQDGVSNCGTDVALTGRVYALATDLNGAIEPGDLLTTSDIPGHLMKATDESKSHGAIIGKAMSRLAAGEGLVLVLVNLQ